MTAAAPTDDPVLDRALRWISGTDTGLSSETLWRHMLGQLQGTRIHYPYDPADFGRCHRLLGFIPEWRGRLAEMSALSPVWRAYVERWDDMERLYLRDLPTGRCEELYRLMQKLRVGGSARPHETP